MDLEFVGYAMDCVVSGRVALDSDRLTDLLSGREEYHVEDVTLEDLNEDRVLQVERTNVLRAELCVVAATGPRGNAGRRVRTRPHPMRAQVGPYEVFGHIHAMPTADPVTTALRRSVIPMTAGWIRYRRGGELVERSHEGMLLNRDRIEWLAQASDEDARLGPSLKLPTAADPRARDLTGELFA